MSFSILIAASPSPIPIPSTYCRTTQGRLKADIPTMTGWFSLPDLAAKVNNITQSIGEGATKITQDLHEKVNALATFELEDIGKAIQNAEEDIVAEETKIKQEDAGLKQEAVKILPWETRVEEKSIFCHGLMEKVLALSLEESNFTTAPAPTVMTADGGNDDLGCKLDEETSRHPNGTASAATFPLERHINIATRMLALDPNLAKIHARLIAKMPEETFWYHYFSRIETLREDVGLEQLCEDLPQAVSGISSEEYDKISHGEVQGITPPSGPPPPADHSSDQEANDDFSDLGDLDDLDDDSDPTIDATLEAEIAAEIGED